MIENPKLETPNQEDFTQEKYRETLDKTYPEDPRFTQEKYRETLKPLTSLEALKEEVEPFNGEETLKAIEGLGEIPKESRKGLSKKSFVLDTLLNFFSSEKESPDRMENTLEGTIGGTINDQVDVNSQPEVEDTTGFKMPEFGSSLEEEPKAIEESPVGVLSAPPILKEKILTDKITAKSDDLARIYNASPTETERSGWSNNGKERYKKYREGNLKELYRGVEDKSEEAEANITALKKTLDKNQKTFSYDLKAANVSFEDFKEYMILAYGSETIFGTYINPNNDKMESDTGVVGELQVTRPTFMGKWGTDEEGNTAWISGVLGGNKPFGPKMAEALKLEIVDEEITHSDGTVDTRKVIKGHSTDAALKKLLVENKEFSFMAGIAVMINKLQGQR